MLIQRLLATITAVALLTATAPAKADERAVATVSGMVCAFCAQGIRKAFERNDAVSAVTVDLDTHLVSLDFKPQHSLSDKEISATLQESGFNLVSVVRQNTEASTGSTSDKALVHQ